MAKVKNVNGSSRFSAPAGYDSWIEYWEAQTKEKASSCGATDCSNKKDLEGCHVQKVLGNDQHYYITPLCSACNKRTDEFYVNSELVPVPSNL